MVLAAQRMSRSATGGVGICKGSVATLQPHLFGGSLPEGSFEEEWFSLSERDHLRLQRGSDLFQASNRQAIGNPKGTLVGATVESAIGFPTARLAFAVGAKTAL